jgi:uncharacterized protein involved in exopolysaccharide biosynthesis
MVDQEYPEQEGFTVHPSGEQGGDLPEPADEFSLVEIASVLLRERGLILRVTLLFTTISLVIALLRPTLYTSFASFVPESSSGNGASGALALAQQFGVSLGSMGGEERSPQFYAGLVNSREIVRQAVTRRYSLVPTEEGPDSTDLITYYEIEEETEAAGIERAMESLSDDLFVSSDRETGVVSFSVTTKDPQGVATFILERVNDFDLTTRRSQASAEKVFSGERLAQLSGELREAEDSLAVFLLEKTL